MAVMVYSDAWGKLIHEKNQKSKISWHCPFNQGVLSSAFWTSNDGKYRTPCYLAPTLLIIFENIDSFWNLSASLRWLQSKLPNPTDAGRPTTFWGKYHALNLKTLWHRRPYTQYFLQFSPSCLSWPPKRRNRLLYKANVNSWHCIDLLQVFFFMHSHSWRPRRRSVAAHAVQFCRVYNAWINSQHISSSHRLQISLRLNIEFV